MRIRREVRGREHVLSFNARALDEAAEWIERHRALWRARLRALDVRLQEEDRAARRRARATRKGRNDRIR